MKYGDPTDPFLLHEWVGPPGLSGNGKGKGGKGDSKGNEVGSDQLQRLEEFGAVADAMAASFFRVMSEA